MLHLPQIPWWNNFDFYLCSFYDFIYVYLWFLFMVWNLIDEVILIRLNFIICFQKILKRQLKVRVRKALLATTTKCQEFLNPYMSTYISIFRNYTTKAFFWYTSRLSKHPKKYRNLPALSLLSLSQKKLKEKIYLPPFLRKTVKKFINFFHFKLQITNNTQEDLEKK